MAGVLAIVRRSVVSVLDPADEGSGAGELDSGRWSYFLYHPHLRLFIAFLLPACNFLMYGEDPMVHGVLEADVPVFGHAVGLIFLRYPPSGWIAFFKVLTWIVGLPLGVAAGRVLLHHLVLRDALRIPCFGWKYIDDDDLKAPRFYNPLHRNTPYNQQWWWGDPLGGIPQDVADSPRLLAAFRQGAHYSRSRGVLAAITKATDVGMGAADADDAVPEPEQMDWDRAQYQQTEETLLEVACPSLFHPRKHREHSKGTALVTGVGACLFLTLLAELYNRLFVAAEYPGLTGKASREYYSVDGRLGWSEHEWGQFAAVFTWLADLLNMVACTDSVLQELWRHQKAVYPADEEEAGEVDRVLSEHRRLRPRFAAVALGGSEDATKAAASKLASQVSGPMPRLKLGYVRCLRAPARVWSADVGPCTVRVLAVWLFSAAATGAVLAAIVGELAEWDEWQDETTGSGSTELLRCLLASAIAFMGPLTVIQDWEWPRFAGVEDVRVPGFTTTEISCGQNCKCDIPKVTCCRMVQTDRDGRELPPRKLPCTACYITNRWFTFVPFALSLVLDFIMLKDTYGYEPGEWGQYVNPSNDRICVTRNVTLAKEIKEAWERGEASPVNYTVRALAGYLHDENGTDFCLPARYTGVSGALKLIVCLPGFLVYLWFVVVLLRYAKVDRLLSRFEKRPASAAPSPTDGAVGAPQPPRSACWEGTGVSAA
eukprot:TRINITY_DN5786_c1_g1_i1.p1 TRINITY_DN5786_c1_g1~~TRINITY_DN5786_c1_g1_i1.p1  ORF type:complete len:712 (+),score=164.00 TRINITY_DN5786_c1_g1_i1:91-2226(+)